VGGKGCYHDSLFDLSSSRDRDDRSFQHLQESLLNSFA
jgi:hypothetical protein